ncbi:pyrroline-5-carboxylate reductase [Anaeromyxobacter paludicola]|uniref:Pyrroline-5-carboxylate reductase n=1 Tax=Anaeromyxobacter paludicola TaxID=2918171 RepID=A0ABN6N558_9BACT|nr:pyrroline-5-carboxylate reductase [Anaeromyxobacter paludicola]BDG07139.1 pyrroline-5-carboxylate reductase [Anaeromyxobacter paludicola]
MALGKTIAFLGAGNMAEALVKGLLRAGTASPEEIVCTVRRPARADELRKRYGVRTLTDNREAAALADVLVLSVKPQVMGRLLDEIAPAVDPAKLVISIAAGVPIALMERKLSRGVRIVRTMPNTPALVGAGATALARGEHATDADLEAARALFAAVGLTVVVEEPLLDACTGLSGSGPAYVFLIIEALSDAGVKVGLPRYTAQALAAQTVLGSAQLLIETGEHPGRLKDQVTSPGGTAIAGLHTLEAGGLRTTLMDAVEAATHRARELGQKFLASED